MFPADPQNWVCPKSNRQCSAKQSARVPFRGITLDTQQKKSSIVPQRLETRHTFHPSPWVYPRMSARPHDAPRCNMQSLSHPRGQDPDLGTGCKAHPLNPLYGYWGMNQPKLGYA